MARRNITRETVNIDRRDHDVQGNAWDAPAKHYPVRDIGGRVVSVNNTKVYHAQQNGD